MKASDIKTGHIYYVDYEPVRSGEFNKVHLSVVLKRNNDKLTFVIMPLTSSPNGDGINKINIGKIAALPPNLRINDTYAVFNQVRTVNASRFIAIKDSGCKISVPLDKCIMQQLYTLLMEDVLYNIPPNEKISIFKQAHDKATLNKAKDLAYTLIKLRKLNTTPETEGKISVLKAEIRETIKDASYTLDTKQIADGIQEIFAEALNA